MTIINRDYFEQHFAYGHLPPHLQKVSKPFGDLARLMIDELPPTQERSAGLRKLLEAKDCMVRAAVMDARDNPKPPPAKND